MVKKSKKIKTVKKVFSKITGGLYTVAREMPTMYEFVDGSKKPKSVFIDFNDKTKDLQVIVDTKWKNIRRVGSAIEELQKAVRDMHLEKDESIEAFMENLKQECK